MTAKTRGVLWFVLLGALSAVMCAPFANAQMMDTGAIVGTVTDQTGAAIPDAKVTATNQGTNVPHATASGAAGEYVIPSLTIGTYSITVEKEGFQSFIQTGIIVDVQSRVEVDPKLQVGAVTERVEVTGAPPLLNTESAEVGTVIASQQIVDLPLNGRMYDQLVFLNPGVFIASGNLFGFTGKTSAGEGYFDANGNSAMQNNYVLDGADNNSYCENFQGHSAQAGQPPVDSLSEFKLQDRTYDVEFGHSAGAVVNAQIKSGSNSLHGDAWEFDRNTDFDANDFFLNASGQPKASYNLNQFGGTLGGPIVKDKAFIFGALEVTRIRQGTPEVGSVPTPLMRQLNFTEYPAGSVPHSPTLPGLAQFSGCFTGGVVSASCPVDPVGDKILNEYPNPNTNLGQDGVTGGYVGNNFISDPKYISNLWDGVIRADQRLSDRDTLFEHYAVWNPYDHLPYLFQKVNPIADGSTDISDIYVRNQNEAVGWTHTLNPTTVLDFRSAHNSMRQNAYQDDLGDIVNPSFGITGVPVIPGISGGLPFFQIAGMSTIGSSYYVPQIEKSAVWQERGIYSKISGAHNIKAGVEWRRDQQNYLDNCCDRGWLQFNGQYTGDGITDLLLGLSNVPALSSYTFAHAYQNGWSFFGQDTWRLTSKLTINYGMRWELVTPLMNRQNHQVNFVPSANGGEGALQEVAPNASGVEARALVEFYKKGFEPRGGFAYKMTDKLVWRGGFGIFNDIYVRRGSLSDLNLNPPYFIYNSPSFSAQTPPSFLLKQGFPANYLTPPDISVPANVATLTLFGEDFHLRPGMIEQTSFGFEYSITPSLLLSASYVGNFGHRLWKGVNLNQKVLTTPGMPSSDVPFPLFSPNPSSPLTTIPTGIQWLESDGNSNFNALYLTLQKRFSHGLSFLISYTNSKGLTDWTNNLDGGFRAGVRNTWNEEAEYGLSPMDTPQRLVTSVSYFLPIGKGSNFVNSGVGGRILEGWKVNGIVTIQSGQPLGIGAPQDYSQTGGSSHANCIGKPSSSFPQTVGDWFDTSAYAVPSEYTFGSCSTTPGPRNPGMANLDASLFKDITFSERWRMQFRAEAFNFMNKAQFGTPATTVGVPGFGAITNVEIPAREIQFGLKLMF